MASLQRIGCLIGHRGSGGHFPLNNTQHVKLTLPNRIVPWVCQPISPAAAMPRAVPSAAASATGPAAAGVAGNAALASATASSSAAAAGTLPGLLFGASSALMVPVYGLMAFFPASRLTRLAVLNPSALYLGLALLYAVALVAAWSSGLGAALAGVAASAHSAAVAGGGVAAVDLSPLARMFSDPLVTLVAWLHLLTLDALMAREVALDGLRTGVATAHSVLLCFFFGPTGLLSHAITRLLSGRGRN